MSKAKSAGSKLQPNLYFSKTLLIVTAAVTVITGGYLYYHRTFAARAFLLIDNAPMHYGETTTISYVGSGKAPSSVNVQCYPGGAGSGSVAYNVTQPMINGKAGPFTFNTWGGGFADCYVYAGHITSSFSVLP